MTVEAANRNSWGHRRFPQYARGAGAVSILIGALVLVGWAFDIIALKSVLPGKIAMKPNTAICFILIGTALMLLILEAGQHVASGARRKVAVACATLAAAIGLATLCEYLFGVDLGIDRLLFRNLLLAKADPGRMAAATTIGFILVGGALVSLDARTKIGRLCSELLALATLLVGAITLLGHIYGVESLHTLFAYTPIAVHTALLFIVLGLGVLLSRPESGLTSVLTSQRGGGVMARRIMPVAVFMLTALAWLRFEGGSALFVASGITILAIWVWLVARSLNLSDVKREQALEALKSSEEQLHLALDAAHLGTFDWNVPENRITWSRWHEEMWGVKHGEFGGTYEAFSERVHADDLPGINTEVARCIAAREPFAREFRVVWPDGSVHWISGNGEFEFSADGQATRMRGAVMEITGRKLGEESLMLFRSLLDRSSDAIEVLDPKTLHYLDCNQSACECLGYTREEFLAMKVFDIDPSVDELTAARIADEMEKSGFALFESVHRRKDGSTFPVEVNVKEIQLERAYLLAVVRDITERKQTEEALRESENRLLTIVEGTQALLVSVDAHGHFTYANDATARAVGYASPEELIGKPYLHFIHLEDRPRVLDTFTTQADLRQPSVVQEFRIVDAAGNIRWFAFLSTLVMKDGEFVGQSGMAQDITERKHSEERLAAQYAVTRALADSVTLAEATPKILRAICETLGWAWGALWIVDREAKVIRCQEAWHDSPVEMTQFETASQELTLGLGVGLPGRVWADREPAWVADVAQDKNFLRAAIAARENLHGALAVPIDVGSKVLGVMEFFSRATREPAPELLAMMTAVSSQIGQFIERKRAEAQILDQLDELRRWQEVILNHADRSQELKREVNELAGRLGEGVRYPSQAAVGNGNELTAR